MKASNRALCVLTAIVGLAAPALSPSATAQSNESMMKDGMMMVVKPNGQMSSMTAEKPMMDMMMKDGKPMSGTHMMMMSGGKVYTMEDKKMPDGKMMSDGMMMKK